jgi:hypothetical protein
VDATGRYTRCTRSALAWFDPVAVAVAVIVKRMVGSTAGGAGRVGVGVGVGVTTGVAAGVDPGSVATVVGVEAGADAAVVGPAAGVDEAQADSIPATATAVRTAMGRRMRMLFLSDAVVTTVSLPRRPLRE